MKSRNSKDCLHTVYMLSFNFHGEKLIDLLGSHRDSDATEVKKRELQRS